VTTKAHEAAGGVLSPSEPRVDGSCLVAVVAPEQVSHQVVCTAIHEAGHVVAAHQLGIRLKAVTIEPRETTFGT
jgi:hypothetical protein